MAFLVTTWASRADAQVTDNKIWSGVSTAADLNKKLRVSAEFQHRFGIDAGHDKTFAELGLRYELHEQVRVALGLRGGLATDEEEVNSQLRVFGDLAWRRRFDKFRIGTRARLQNENEAGRAKQAARLRFKGAFRPVKGYEVYSSFEWFYRIDAKELRQHRWTLGFELPLANQWSADLAYRFEEEFFVNNPETSHIFAVGFSYQFDEDLF